MDKEEMKEVLDDHDLLIKANIKLDRLILDHDNHLHHHWMVSIALLSVTFMSVTTALITIFVK